VLPGFLTAALLSVGLVGIQQSAGPATVLADSSAQQQIVAWGDNSSGELGSSSIVLATARRTPVQGLPSARSLAAGYGTSFAADADGRLYAWGNDGDNAMPFPQTANAFHSPVLVPGVTGVRTVAAAFGQAGAAVTNSGALYTWGHFRGDGQEAYDYHPYQVQGLPAVQEIVGNGHGWMVLGTDGSVWTWGANQSGQLGDGTTTAHYLPLPVLGLPRISSIAAGDQFGTALATDGTVWSWGNNTQGQLGQGTVASPTQSSSPAQVPNVSGVTQLAAGYESTIILKSDHTVWGWGCNGLGTFQGSCAGAPYAVAVPMHLPFDGAVSIAAGGVTAVTMSDGSVETSGGRAASGGGTQCPTDDRNRCDYPIERTAVAPVVVAGLRNPSLLAVGDDHVLAVADVVGLAGAAPEPDAVLQHLRPTDMHSGEFTLSWDAPTPKEGVNVAITGYTVALSGRYTRSDGSPSTYDPITVGPNVHSYTFHVPNGTLILAAAVAPLSATATFGGTYDVFYVGYPRPPASVSTERAAPHQLKVSWPVAADNGSPITRYDVFANPKPGDEIASERVAQVDPGSTSITLTDGQLAPGGDMAVETCSPDTNFSVYAVNQNGRSQPSPISNLLAAVCEPSAPTGITAKGADSSATVSWQAPYDGGSAITGYKVYANGAYLLATGASARSGTVTGLSNGHYYAMTVVAVNDIGSSTSSSQATAAVFPPLPSPPVNVHATPSGSQTVIVSWDPPANHPERAHDYYVENASTGRTVATARDGDTSVGVTGLTNNTSYQFYVTTNDAFGQESSPSSPSNAVTPVGPATVPGAPARISAVAGDTTANLTWVAPSDDGGNALSGYLLTVNPGGRQIAVGVTPKGTVTGLTNGTPYTFSIRARNAVGLGPAVATPASATPVAIGRLHPVTPSAAYNSGAHPLVAGADRDVVIAGLPTSANAAVLTAHVSGPTAAGSLRVASPRAVHASSYLAFVRGQSNAAELTVPLDGGTAAGGRVRLHLSGGQANVSFNLVGYFTPTASGDTYRPVTPAVAYNSGTALSSASDSEVTLSGLPTGADVARVSAHVISPTAAGTLRLSAPGTAPATSSLNYAAKTNATAEITVKVSNGKVRIHLSAGQARLALDLLGYYSSDASADAFHPLTYPSSGGTGSQPLVSGTDREVTLAGLPAGAVTAMVSATVTGASAAGDLRLSAAGTQPATSSVGYAPGRTSIGEAIVQVVNGRVRLHLSSGKATVSLDLVGYSRP
jgi:alpha-tubulin suppressor-like RCC1 family protein